MSELEAHADGDLQIVLPFAAEVRRVVVNTGIEEDAMGHVHDQRAAQLHGEGVVAGADRTDRGLEMCDPGQGVKGDGHFVSSGQTVKRNEGNAAKPRGLS